MIGKRFQREYANEDNRGPFRQNPKHQLDPRVDRGDGHKNSQREISRPHQTGRLIKSPTGEKRARSEEKREIKGDEGLASDEAFYLAPKNEEHVHLDREPENARRRMDEGVGEQLVPGEAVAHSGTIKPEPVKKRAAAQRHQKASGHQGENMRSDENCGDIDRVASHPRHRSVIIGGSDSEHASIDSRGFIHASERSRRPKKFLENRANRKKFVFRSITSGSTSY